MSLSLCLSLRPVSCLPRHPISTPFTSLCPAATAAAGGPRGGPLCSFSLGVGDLKRDTYSECYCLSSSLTSLVSSPNPWIWVRPTGAPPGGPPPRLLRLLSVPAETEGDSLGASCRCWRGALAVPARSAGGAPESDFSEEETGDEVSCLSGVAPADEEGPLCEALPLLFLPPHIFSSLGLVLGDSNVEVAEALEFVKGGSPDTEGAPQGLSP